MGILPLTLPKCSPNALFQWGSKPLRQIGIGLHKAFTTFPIQLETVLSFAVTLDKSHILFFAGMLVQVHVWNWQATHLILSSPSARRYSATIIGSETWV